MNSSLPTHAMLLAAGLGERLRPLTLSTPKPLIPVSGHPLIEYNIRLLKKFGVEKLVINLFHLGEKIQSSLGDGKRFGLKIDYSPESQLLGTGGGVKAAEKFLGGKRFWLMNADILIDLDLKKVFETHQSGKALATLAVTPSSRKDIQNWVFVGDDGQILEIGDKAPPGSAKKTVFTGVHLVEPTVLDLLPAGRKSCIIQDAYDPLLRQGKKLNALLFEGYWRDLGTAERYEEVKKEFAARWPYTTLKPEDFI